MSTHAEIEIFTPTKSFKFWKHADGYPECIISNLIDTIDLEELKIALHLEDFHELTPDYYYEIYLKENFIKIFDNSYLIDKKWNKGDLIFSGSFIDAKNTLKGENDEIS